MQRSDCGIKPTVNQTKNNGKRRTPKRSASRRKGGMQIEDLFDLHRFNAQANGWVPKSQKYFLIRTR